MVIKTSLKNKWLYVMVIVLTLILVVGFMVYALLPGQPQSTPVKVKSGSQTKPQSETSSIAVTNTPTPASEEEVILQQTESSLLELDQELELIQEDLNQL